jgi:hypothetical protein
MLVAVVLASLPGCQCDPMLFRLAPAWHRSKHMSLLVTLCSGAQDCTLCK